MRSYSRREAILRSAGLAGAFLCGAPGLGTPRTLLGADATPARRPFLQRGYYLTFMRMPIMGLVEWKQAFDCFAEDAANLVILWTAGGFRSRKFPITWRYNQEHTNVREDFVRDLIDYAHSKNIRVLLGFTPFGYDGVNQLPLLEPELKARGQDGRPVDAFGIHCWGWNLCPSQPAAQRFMLDYVREMFLDFYPNADGLFIESSDYGVCHCPECGPKFYEREFQFVRAISDEAWRAKAEATVVIYPHYFTGKPVPGLNVTAAKLPFDPRWTLFFTPHSAYFDADLLRKARSAISWSDTPVLGTPERTREHALAAHRNGMTGFVPSLEAYSFIPQHPEGGESFVVGKRRRPWGLDPAGEGRMPYRSLPARISRFAVREFSADPELPLDTFRRRLGEYLFGTAASPTAVADALALQSNWVYESDWSWPSPLLDPEFLVVRAKHVNWTQNKLDEYRRRLEQMRGIAVRYAQSSHPAEQEMHRLAQQVVDRWRGKENLLSS